LPPQQSASKVANLSVSLHAAGRLENLSTALFARVWYHFHVSGGQLSILFISSCGAQEVDALQGGDGAKEGGATTARAANQKDKVRQLSRLVHTRAQPSVVWSAKTTGFRQACTCHQQLLEV